MHSKKPKTLPKSRSAINSVVYFFTSDLGRLSIYSYISVHNIYYSSDVTLVPTKQQGKEITTMVDLFSFFKRQGNCETYDSAIVHGGC